MFVARVVGESMVPSIPNGAYCLFSSPVAGSRQGRMVLVQLQDGLDPETGQRYTVKRYHSETVADENNWRHSRITLSPENPDFEPIVLRPDYEEAVAVVAEVVEVLGVDAPVGQREQ